MVKTDYFEYTHLESDIHRFEWMSRSEEALTAYFEIITNIYQSVTDSQQIIRILHDYRLMPFLPPASIFPKTRELQSNFPDQERKIAYLLDDDMTENLVETLTQTLGRSGTRRYFTANQEQDAIAWLLQIN